MAAAPRSRMKAARPDLVALDVMLPGLDRFQVCRRLRERSGVPVIMLTARGEAVERICGRELGADDCCGPLVHSGLELDECSHEVRVDGSAGRAHRPRVDLLAFFLRRPGDGLPPRGPARPGLGLHVRGHVDAGCARRPSPATRCSSLPTTRAALVGCRFTVNLPAHV
ncbi:MAG: response regulator [Egibacteraceae bacterium]